MAFDMVSAYAESATPFYVTGDPGTSPTLVEAPQQITLRFSPGVVIDSSAASLGSISMRRSGRGGDAFGGGGAFADVPVEFGSILVDDSPNQNQIVIRFREMLPDDSYQIVIGSGLQSTNRGSVNPSAIDLRLQLGSFVAAVVPQPAARTGAALSQSRDAIDVYFNTDEPLQRSSVETASMYRVIEVDAAGNDFGAALIPTTVTFNADTGRARLLFDADLPDGKLFRLDIGGQSVTTQDLQGEDTDENSTFSDAQDLGILGRTDVGSLSPTVTTLTGVIDNRMTVPTPAGGVGFPSQPGTVDEPGHRDTTVDSGAHGLPFATVDPATGITVIEYNFRSDYGVDPQGNPLQNVITETQKQRAREVFELYALVAGVRFVETPSNGICIATGDLRALDPSTSVTGVAGLGGGTNVVLNSTIDWGASEYGGYWFNVAMHEIGHALGLGHSYDLPSIMGNALPGEAVFPGDYDIVHLRQLYQPNGSDIDIYRFELPESGTFAAETLIARPGQEILSSLDSVLSLYRQEVVNGKTVRTLVARNDDYYGRDSFVGLTLDGGTYFLAVTSVGNTAFNAEIPDSGNGGRSEGDYELRLRFTPASTTATSVVDASGTPLDGDRDGTAGGAFSFWFRTASVANTVFVDKTAAAGGNGAISAPYSSIKSALDSLGSRSLLRIVGNDAGRPYLIGTDLSGRPLSDGSTFTVPKGVTAMIDAGAILKLRATNLDVGSSSPLVGTSRAEASLQVLGIPGNNVAFTSYHDDTVGGDSDGVGPKPSGGQWGGIVFREDSDAASKKAFINTVTQATISYGGGQVVVDSQLASFAPIQIESTRPTIAFSTVTNSAGAAIAATPNSFEDTAGRVGPEIRGNRLTGNSINGLFIKIDTGFGRPLEQLEVPARLRSTDIVYVLQENLVIAGGAGGYLDAEGGGTIVARQTGRLVIDPGVVLKLQGSRIELERGTSQLIAEGTAGQRVVITSLGDNRFGAGGSFDTNGNLPDKFDAFGTAVGTLTVGDWGGIIANAGSKASLDHAYVAFGGGTTPIEGAFDAFNVIEVHQANLRLTNSRLENSASGQASSTRDGRGTNAGATVFVRGAQPIIVGNDFRSNAGAVVSINANSLADVERPDVGRSTGAIERFTGYDDNNGPLIRSNRMSYGGTGLATAGLAIRGEEITVESVWDDTDIPHVLTSEIIVKNFHTATGLRLVSKPNESLVVKLLGAGAGFTASGYGLDVDDRTGGTVQIVGQPGYPVILTSLRDDTVGAGLDPLGNIVKDTNTDGTGTSAAANDWRSLKFMPYSNDRNVAIAIESEKAYTGGIGKNDTVFDAQPLGVLASNVATGTNTTESVQEKSGDANRRLGFEVHGFISADTPSDVDTYQFTGYAGSEVWIDLDKTSSALDAMVELLDASGNVLARSVDSALEGGVVNAEVQMDLGTATDAVYTLDHLGVVAASLTGVIWDLSDPTAPMAIQTFTCDGDGVLAFRNVLNQPASPAVTGSCDAVTGEVTVTYAAAIPTAIQFQYRYAEGPLSPATLGGAQALGKNSWLGGDYDSLNPRDPGMRVVLPGPAGGVSSYFIRIRSQPRYGGSTTQADYEAALTEPASLAAGASGGRYELRLRLRQRDEKPGSTVRYADIRYPATGIDVQGLPRNSLLAGETGENSTDANNAFGTAQYVGNLLQSDRNTISIAGRISTATDVDWYTFALNYEQIQAIAGVNASGQTFATMFDIDYADGFRGDLTISVFDENGTLMYVGRDSNVADDQPGTGQGNDFDDLSRGSVGKLDPFIGSVTLPAGTPTNAGGFTAGGRIAAPTTAEKGQQQRYYVAVSSNEQLPTQLNFTVKSAAANTNVRLEPISSLRRVVEDHIGDTGYTSGAGTVDPATAKPLVDVLNLSAHVTAFTLGDVTLFVSSKTGLSTYDAVTGNQETVIRTGIAGTPIGDLDMRRDGRLYAYAGVTGSTTTVGRLLELDPGNGATLSSDDDGIENQSVTTPLNFQTTSDDVTALAFKRTAVGTFGELWFAVTDGGASKLYRAADGGSATTAADAQADQTQATSTTLGFHGAIEVAAGDQPAVTGLQFVDEVGGKLLGVTRDGRFIEITPGAKTVTSPADTDPMITAAANVLATFTTQLTAIGAAGFEALASAPLNLQGGRFAGTLFALTDTGCLCVIDPRTNTLVDLPEWGGLFSPPMGAGLTGIAFSPLDFNLWHTTTNRQYDAGHGIPAATDGSRDAVDGGRSMYFGLEEFNTAPQYGLMAAAIHQDLAANPLIGSTSIAGGTGTRSGNYNLPGGAYGSLTTNSFSLEGYEYADKPTVYFNYFLETQQGSGKVDEMRDSARVLVSIDGGLTWELLATNNSSLSTINTTNAELPNFPSVSSKISTVANQHVQQLFDGTGVWRQARVDLGRYAGSPSVQLRFDVSTAGEFDAAAKWSTTRTVQARVTATDLLPLDDVTGLEIGDLVAGKGIPSNTTVVAVDPATNEVTLSEPVTVPKSAVLSFESVTRLRDDILDKAGTTGNFTSLERGQKNDYEGFYIDDILVGFAERGEMVTGAVAGQTGFFDVNTPKSTTIPEQTLFGEYQLEIRRGTDYVASGQIEQVFDTNAAMISANSRAAAIGNVLGDANVAREQGAFLIENNVVSNAGGYGIAVDAAARDGESNMPHPGVARNLPVLNASRLVPGVVIMNNVISTSGTGGILFSGDAASGAVPAAVVPFGRIVNNTIWGGPAATGIGVDVRDNAGPTLLNNVFASLAVGVKVDASSAARTVVATSAFYSTATPVTGVGQSQGITLPSTPFVNAAGGNFYPVQGSAVIDSAINSLQDRSDFVAVNSAVGIGASPILTPDRDLYGQLRSDDPNQASEPGLGGNVFKDRGAIDRVDFAQPYAMIAAPLDDGLDDLAPSSPNVVVLRNAARGQTSFVLQLDDVGIGIDKSSVIAEAFSLSWEGTSLVEGTDYVFRYLETSNRVVFESASVFRLGSYILVATSRENGPDGQALLVDYADNTLLPNNTDGTTTFLITLADGPDAPTALTGMIGDGYVDVTWTPPLADNGSAIIDYEIEYSANGSFPGSYLPSPPSTASSRRLNGLANGMTYWFRVRAVNAAGGGTWSQIAGPLMPLGTPTLTLANDIGDSATDGISRDGAISVNGLNTASGAVWQHSLDDGSTWSDGTGAAFTAPSGTYPAGMIKVRQMFPAGNPNTSGIGVNTTAITIDAVAPTVIVTSDRTTARTGESVSITFLLSEPSTTFAAEDVTVSGGSLTLFSGTGAAYTAVFTPNGTGPGMVGVKAGTFNDTAGNQNLAGDLAAPITIDDIAPTLVIASDKSTLLAGQTALLTFTLSEPSKTFAVDDVIVTGGSLSGFSGSEADYTAIFTPFTNSTVPGSVTVPAGAFMDAAGNPGTASFLAGPISINTIVPAILIASDRSALKAGETALITFTVSEPTTTFGADDVTASGGALSSFTGSGLVYTALFTPAPGSTAQGVISVAAGRFTNAIGNGNAFGSLVTPISVDTMIPTVVITTNKAALRIGEFATLTFVLSEPSSTFTADDVTVTGGSLSGFAGSGTTYTAAFVPSVNSTADGSVSVPAGLFLDAVGNANAASSLTPPITVDTQAPTVSIATDRAVLRTQRTALITFTLSETSTTFSREDVAVSGGTLANFTGSGKTYTAVFTPAANSMAAGTVTVPANVFVDSAGNPNLAGALTPAIVVDTIPPTVAITSSAPLLRAGMTATISFSLSEPSTTFTVDDIVATGGTLSGFSGSGASYVAVFTPAANSTTSGTVTIAERTFIDAANNPNTAAALSPPLTIDTIVPFATITTTTTTLRAGETALVSFALNKPSTTFTASDVAVTGGTLSAFAGSGATYTALFTPTASSTAPGTISVAAASFVDSAGNPNVASSLAPTLIIDTVPPSVVITTDRPVLRTLRTAKISFQLSEPSTTFTVDDVSATGGTLSGFTGSGANYSAVFTPLPNVTMAGTVGIAAARFTDSVGNPNVAGTLTPPMTVDTVVPTISITSSTRTVRAGQTALISFQLSETSTTFAADDVAVTGGTLSAFIGSGRAYTAVFTPLAGSSAPGTVQVAARAFFDAANNPNAAGELSPALTVDTVQPSVVITSSRSRVGIGETALLGFNLSEPSSTFNAASVLVTGGTISGFAGSGRSYSATFTPAANSATAAVVRVPANRFTDTVGNGNLAGRLASGIAVDTILTISSAIANGVTLGTSSGAAPSVTPRVQTVTVTFNAPVTGLNVNAVKMYYTGSSGSMTAVALTGTTITGSGTTYTITLPSTAASLRGLYQLDIGGPSTTVQAGGVSMGRIASFYWRRP